MDVELLVFQARPSLLSVSEERDKKRRPRQIYVIVYQGTGERNYSFL